MLALIKGAKFFAAQQWINTVSLNAELLILSKLVASSSFGLFSAGLLVASRLAVIPDSLGTAFYPVVAESHVRDPRLASRQVAGFLLLALLICLPVAVGITALAGPIAHLLFAKNAEVCQMVIRITIWCVPLLAIESVAGYSLNAAGKDAPQARLMLYAVISHLVLVVVLVPMFGVVGACWSYLLRTACRSAFLLYLFMKTFEPSLPASRFGRILLANGAMAIALWFARSLIPDWHYLGAHPASVRGWTDLLVALSLQCGLGMFVYAAALILLRVIRTEDWAPLLRRFVKKRPMTKSVAPAACGEAASDDSQAEACEFAPVQTSAVL